VFRLSLEDLFDICFEFFHSFRGFRGFAVEIWGVFEVDTLEEAFIGLLFNSENFP
jgi:hypothetical protein